MSDIFDERRRGLEEEYFARKNREAIEKLREKIAVAGQLKAAATSALTCPRCGDTLKVNRFEDVEIDSCEKCGGVWLDSSEFENLTNRKVGWFGRLLHSLHLD